MKKNRHKKESLLNKRVLVKWIDSNLSERTWVDLEDYETDISEIESYGIVVHENERSISVAGHYAVGNSNTLEQASGIMTIPKACIKELKCKNTGKYFNVRTGTIFENSKVSLRKWMLACYFVVEMKRGVSSLQLSKIVGVTQKTAWFMLQRIHNCFSIEIKEPCLKGEIEVDETYIGGKNKNRHSKDKVKDAQGRSLKDKTPVFGTLQREGFVVAYVVTDTKGKTLLPLIYNTVHPNSTIYSDEWYAYNGIDKEKFDHQKVYHKKGAYVIGRRSTNTIEGYWSHLKKMISGTHFWVSRKHLQRYVDCESFRYNTKHLSESERFDVFLQNTKRRLRYSQLKKITA